MIDEWGIVVLFALGAGFLQAWIITTYPSQSSLFMGIAFLVVAVYLERRRKQENKGVN